MKGGEEINAYKNAFLLLIIILLLMKLIIYIVSLISLQKEELIIQNVLWIELLSNERIEKPFNYFDINKS